MGSRQIFLVPLGPRPRPSSPLPLLPRPVGVAELPRQRRDPLMQTGRLLVGNDRKPPRRVGTRNRVGRQRHARQHIAGHLDHRPVTGPGDIPQPLDAIAASSISRSISAPLACSITTRCSKATWSWRARRP